VIARSAALGVKAQRPLTSIHITVTGNHSVLSDCRARPAYDDLEEVSAWKNGVRKYDANSGTYDFANVHWRHIIGPYSSNRAALVDPMSNSRSEIDYVLYYYHITATRFLVSGAYFFPMPFR
jgi:hypothetical protein